MIIDLSQLGVNYKMAKRSHNSCVYKLSYHLVLVSKYRNPCFNSSMLSFLEQEFGRLLKSKDCALVEFNGEDDHIHAIMELHPSIEPAKLINGLKTASSKLLKREFGEEIKKHYWGTNAIWNRSYCLLTVGGAPIEVLREYIEKQNRPL